MSQPNDPELIEEDEEGRPRESYPNPTQQRIDEEGGGEKPADVSWDEERWGEREPSTEETKEDA